MQEPLPFDTGTCGAPDVGNPRALPRPLPHSYPCSLKVPREVPACCPRPQGWEAGGGSLIPEPGLMAWTAPSHTLGQGAAWLPFWGQPVCLDTPSQAGSHGERAARGSKGPLMPGPQDNVAGDTCSIPEGRPGFSPWQGPALAVEAVAPSGHCTWGLPCARSAPTCLTRLCPGWQLCSYLSI